MPYFEPILAIFGLKTLIFKHYDFLYPNYTPKNFYVKMNVDNVYATAFCGRFFFIFQTDFVIKDISYFTQPTAICQCFIDGK